MNFGQQQGKVCMWDAFGDYNCGGGRMQQQRSLFREDFTQQQKKEEKFTAESVVDGMKMKFSRMLNGAPIASESDVKENFCGCSAGQQ